MDALLEILADAARGAFPEPDGSIELLVGEPAGAKAVVLGFSAHLVIAADIDNTWVFDWFKPGDFSSWLAPGTMMWLASEVGATPRPQDALFCRISDGTGVPDWLHSAPSLEHPRVQRSTQYRSDDAVFATDDGAGVLIIGRGVAGRWELGFEVDSDARGSGLGRRLAAAAAHIVPAGEAVWAQVAPGNASSMRSIIAAGYQPIGSEVLFVAHDT
jgi:hypothetical protein